MIIRSILQKDFSQLKKIHQQFYKDEFSFPDFVTNYLCSFVVAEGEEIICASGIKTILESVVITNKDFSVRKRREALYEILNATAHISSKNGFDQIHAFIQDSDWESHLKKVGFKPTKGNALVLNLE